MARMMDLNDPCKQFFENYTTFLELYNLSLNRNQNNFFINIFLFLKKKTYYKCYLQTNKFMREKQKLCF